MNTQKVDDLVAQSLRLSHEYNDCVRRGHRVYDDVKAAKIVCNVFSRKLDECRLECDNQTSQLQQEAFKKCITTAKTDQELDTCISQQAGASTVKICKVKCGLTAVQNYKSI